MWGHFILSKISGNTVIAFTPDGKLGLTVGGNLCDLRSGKCLPYIVVTPSNTTAPSLITLATVQTGCFDISFPAAKHPSS